MILHIQRVAQESHSTCSCSSSVGLVPTLVYDPANDTFKDIETGTVYADNGEGSYESAAGVALEPGWRTPWGFQNFKTILTDPLIRDPFVRVFIWTFVFAFVSVLIQFAIGLFLAITLKDQAESSKNGPNAPCSCCRSRCRRSSRSSSGRGY